MSRRLDGGSVGRIVVMGVAGCGKSTLALALSARLGVPFLEGDKFHSGANVEKMASGIPLHDADRWPWLAAVRTAMRDEPDAVVTCSALRRSYRDALRAAGDVRFVYLAASREEITRRLASRQHHYMHVDMVASQFGTLEPPAPDETDVAVIPATDDATELLATAERALATLRSGTAVGPLLADGAGDREITPAELTEHVRRIALGIEGRRILLVP